MIEDFELESRRHAQLLEDPELLSIYEESADVGTERDTQFGKQEKEFDFKEKV